jgi:hypothetical protein
MIWLVPTLILVGALVEDELSIAASWAIAVHVGPAILAGWLAGSSAFGVVKISPVLGKCLALAGLLIGILALYLNMPQAIHYLTY